jgi:hypothetical protein
MLTKTMGLKEIIEYKASLEKQFEESGEVVPDGIMELSDVADQLLKGKIDQAARFRAGLEAGIEAAKMQASYLQDMLETTERLMKEAVVASGGMKIDGDVWRLRIQNNSRASTIIDDSDRIPRDFCNVSFSTSFKYDEKAILFWAGAHLGRVIKMKTDLVESEKNATVFYRMEVTPEERKELENEISIAPSKSMIEASLKRDPVSVPGARLERGTHLRVETGKTKAIEDKPVVVVADKVAETAVANV